MKNNGVVIDADDKKAYVFIKRAPACEGCRRRCCGDGNVCGTAKEDAVIVENTLGVKKGDEVTVSVETGRTLAFLTVLFTVPPLLALALYFILSEYVTERTAVCGLSALVMSVSAFVAVYLIFGRKIMKSGSYVKLEGVAERG